MGLSIKRTLRKSLSPSLYGAIRHVAYLFAVSRDLMVGQTRNCNVCGHHGRFRAFGRPPRYGAECPRCLSVERQRLLKLWVDKNKNVIEGRSVLHFAPEFSVQRFLQPIAGRYQSADLNPAHADLVLNIESIDMPDESVDVVVVSHVLEHVNDVKALAELHRVVKPGGLAVIMVPVVEGWDKTYEDDRIVDAKDRIAHFGQWDHVRIYGRDIRQRIGDAGFRLEEVTALEPEVQTFGLARGEKIFVAHKS
jgi:SAM-dependent methyltransferase